MVYVTSSDRRLPTRAWTRPVPAEVSLVSWLPFTMTTVVSGDSQSTVAPTLSPC